MPAKTVSPPRRQSSGQSTLHPTVSAVVYFLYYLPVVRRAVWQCNDSPEVTKGTPAAEIQPHKFIRVLQQLFLKIQRGEPWSQADQQWSQKIVGIPGHVCFDICRNYMLGQLLTAIPELDDFFTYMCDQDNHYPDIGAVESREAPAIPLTFGSPAHEAVPLELQDAGQMGHGALVQCPLSEDVCQEVRDKFAEMGLGIGDSVMRFTRCRYDPEHFPAIFIGDRWTVHPCAPIKTKRGDVMCARVSPHPQARPPAEVDMGPLFPWPSGTPHPPALPYILYSVTTLKGYEWAENFREGTEVQGNVMTSMGTFTVYVNEQMRGQWVEVNGRAVRPLTWGEVGTILLAPNVMVVSYCYVAQSQVPTLFPPPSTLAPPPLITAKQCANPACGSPPADGASHPRCSRCHLVGYCQPECQKSHWRTHKVVCSSTACLDDVLVPLEPPATVRPPFGKHCQVCIPIMVRREHEWLSKQSLQHLVGLAHAMKAPLPKSRAKLQRMTPQDLADLLIHHAHPGVLKKKKEKPAAPDQDAGEEEDEEEDLEEELEEEGEEYDLSHPTPSMAPRRALSASESAMQSYALPAIIAMLAILVAFSWLG